MDTTRNPYAPPGAPVADAVSVPDISELGSHGQRLGTFLIDWVPCYILGIAVRATISLAGPTTLNDVGLCGILALDSAIWGTYYFIAEAACGGTLGKWITRTRVVGASGAPASFVQLLGRTIIRFVPFEPFSFFGSAAVGWHDRWSGTRVVRVSR